MYTLEMPELEFIPLSINQQISATSNIRLNQPSVASNSNSATSINRGGNISMDLRGNEAVSVGSVASGSGSIINADDSALDVNSTKTSASRPTSPEVTNPANTTAGSTTTTTSTVKSNFRSWFSSSNPNKQQQQLQQQNTGISTSATSGSGNFGMDSNCITSSQSVNINATNNTTSTTTTTSGTTTTTINKNSLNSELQSLQDNNQGSFLTTALNTITLYPVPNPTPLIFS